jgi:two-component system, NtrC family, nitrogen regulation response regulator GlnG
VDAPGHTVLVVDDDASIRFLCRVNLELDGWTVREAATIDAARAALAAGDVDVLLLDVHVGPASGVEFLSDVRAEHPDLPVAMLTGSVHPSRSDDPSAADAVIAKPFTLEELTGTVRKLAARTAQKSG